MCLCDVYTDPLERLPPPTPQRPPLPPSAVGGSASAAGDASSSGLTTVRDFAHYAELLAASPMVCVDFTAEWCPPSKECAPMFHKLVDEFGKRVSFLKVDLNEGWHAHSEIRETIPGGLDSIPRFVLLLRGKALPGLFQYSECMDGTLRTALQDMVTAGSRAPSPEPVRV
jgi:thiol-disulfide isomerase/thioredoxin